MATAKANPVSQIWVGHLFSPPAYTRLEPQSFSGDPTPGVGAAMHDPLWALFRQWQTGEFAGEDAGTPLSVTISGQSEPLTLFQAGDPDAAAPAPVRPLSSGAALDRMVEREPRAEAGPNVRTRAEAAMVLAAALSEAGMSDATQTLADLYPFPALPDSSGPLGAAIMLLPDAEQAARAIEADVPAWAQGAAASAAAEWLAWYRGKVSPLASGGSWIPERLEYRFSVATGGTGRVFTSPMHLGGDIDWYALDHRPGQTMTGESEIDPFPRTVGGTVLTAPLRFPGMPADRFWEFEDAHVNLAAMTVQVNDAARLALIEFATINGGNWYTAALDVSASSFTTVDPLVVRDSFGTTSIIKRAADGVGGVRFRMFETTGLAADAQGLLMIGGARGAIDGTPCEEVLLLRDEGANLVWAVEHLVEDELGRPRHRRDEPWPTIPQLAAVEGTDLRYVLETGVPRHWIPFVPTLDKASDDGFVLRKGTMSDQDDSVGRILAGRPVDLFDEEVPRGGVRVSRVTSLARDPDGHLATWVAYRVGQGLGEAASNYASDLTLPAS